jgi:hypothetical protein
LQISVSTNREICTTVTRDTDDWDLRLRRHRVVLACNWRAGTLRADAAGRVVGLLEGVDYTAKITNFIEGGRK